MFQQIEKINTNTIQCCRLPRASAGFRRVGIYQCSWARAQHADTNPPSSRLGYPTARTSYPANLLYRCTPVKVYCCFQRLQANPSDKANHQTAHAQTHAAFGARRLEFTCFVLREDAFRTVLTLSFFLPHSRHKHNMLRVTSRSTTSLNSSLAWSPVLRAGQGWGLLRGTSLYSTAAPSGTAVKKSKLPYRPIRKLLVANRGALFTLHASLFALLVLVLGTRPC